MSRHDVLKHDMTEHGKSEHAITGYTAKTHLALPLCPRSSRLHLCFFLLCFLLFPFLTAPAQASLPGRLKLTTWNMDWLTLRPTADPALPADIPSRGDADFLALRHYAMKLSSDLIAFEEVDGSEAARRVFPTADYDLLLTPDPVIQRVGLAIRHRPGLTATLNPELTALNVYPPSAPHPLRGGLDVTLHYGTGQLRLLIIHLKTGCWAQPLNAKKHACPILYQQFRLIEDWILDRQDDGIPFAILGDFNRRLVPADPIMKNLQSDASLTLTTAGHASPCHGGELFIDHIILGNQARNWLIPDSLRVMTFHDAPAGLTLSDHCPVSVSLALPGR